MKLHKLLAAAIYLFLFVVCGTANSGETASEKLNVFVQSVITFKANFKQTILDSNGIVMEEAQGQFLFQRPGKFRWDYQQPYLQQIVADGERIWFYDVDLEQVTVKSQLEALADTPATLLSGDTLPEDKYLLTNIDSDDDLFWLELIPKDVESNFQTVTLTFDKHHLQQVIMKDSFGQRTRLVFTHVSENTLFETDQFVFLPPEGVDVVGDPGL